MPPKDGAAQGAPPGGRGGDRLSGLRDEVLLRVMSHLKAWEAVRTCVLSKRWRVLWASASRLDVRQSCPLCLCGGDSLPAPRLRARERNFTAFITALLLRRRQRVPLDSLRLCWTRETIHGDANTWVAHAVRRGAEEIELSAKHHPGWYPSPEYMSFIADDNDTFKIRLKVLKFVYMRLDATTLTQLCSRCTCLEELELKDCQISRASKIRSTMLKCLTMIRCRIPKGLSVYAPNLASLEFSRNIGYVPWIQNMGLLAASNINQQAPHKYPKYPGLGSCNVKILKLSRVMLDDTTLAQLYSVCTSLEELELKDCLVVGKEIRSKSLRSLTMIKCEFAIDSGVNVPNLLSLRCTRLFRHVPRFRNMEFIVTAIIALDDSCMSSDSQWTWGEDDIDESDDDDDFFAHLWAEDSGDSSDSEPDEDEDAESDHGGDLPAHSGAEDSDDNSNSESDPDEHDESDHGGDLPAHSGAEDSDDNSDSEFSQYDEDKSGHDGNQFVHSGADSNDNSDNEPHQDEKDESDHDVESDPDGAHSSAEESHNNCNAGNDKSDNNNEDKSYLDDDIFGHAAAEDSDDEADGRTMGYDEIAEEYNGDCGGMFGGDGMLCNLSNVRRMDLSAHSGEVLLMRESKSCTDFKDLKTLSLGEWCITPDLDVLASILRRSPNLENLFVHLDMANKSRVGFNTRANSFSCTNLKKVEITCCKHDKMVHILARFFLENGITCKKIFVHHTACTCDVKRDTDSQAKRKAETEAEKRPTKQINQETEESPN